MMRTKKIPVAQLRPTEFHQHHDEFAHLNEKGFRTLLTCVCHQAMLLCGKLGIRSKR